MSVISSARELADVMSAKLGVSTAVVTLGASGCVAYSANTTTHYPAHEVTAIDTTGAGDAFVATFAANLAAGAAVADVA
ncbi:MAG: PfkB family carbohydrate kinase [Trebonia sp.]